MIDEQINSILLIASSFSAVFAIKQIAHCFPAGGVGPLVGFERISGVCAGRFLFAAIRTAIGKSGLTRFEFEFFSADHARFDGMGHKEMILRIDVRCSYPRHRTGLLASEAALSASPLETAFVRRAKQQVINHERNGYQKDGEQQESDSDYESHREDA